jgi:hypothetical protein
MIKKLLFFNFLLTLFFSNGYSQTRQDTTSHILFHGLVMDALTLSPVGKSQIIINGAFSSSSDQDGRFSFYVRKNDTVVFKSLGYKPATMLISDTLKSKDFIAGIYLSSDTLEIAEVVILPRNGNLRSEIINSKSKVPSTMDNARYNVAVSAYQAKTTQGNLDDPTSHYSYISHKQKINAFEKGGIPSDQIAGLNPLMLLPAAYLLIHGLPKRPAAMRSDLTQNEIDQINRKYLQLLEQRK